VIPRNCPMNSNWFRVPSICACCLLCAVRATIQDQINLQRKYNFVEWSKRPSSRRKIYIRKCKKGSHFNAALPNKASKSNLHQTKKNVRYLAFEFELDQSKRKSSQVLPKRIRKPKQIGKLR